MRSEFFLTRTLGIPEVSGLGPQVSVAPSQLWGPRHPRGPPTLSKTQQPPARVLDSRSLHLDLGPGKGDMTADKVKVSNRVSPLPTSPAQDAELRRPEQQRFLGSFQEFEAAHSLWQGQECPRGRAELRRPVPKKPRARRLSACGWSWGADGSSTGQRVGPKNLD